MISNNRDLILRSWFRSHGIPYTLKKHPVHTFPSCKVIREQNPQRRVPVPEIESLITAVLMSCWRQYDGKFKIIILRAGNLPCIQIYEIAEMRRVKMISYHRTNSLKWFLLISLEHPWLQFWFHYATIRIATRTLVFFAVPFFCKTWYSIVLYRMIQSYRPFQQKVNTIHDLESSCIFILKISVIN